MSAAKTCKIPVLSKELAEETGIHIGDGWMKFKKYFWGTSYRYSISGDYREKEYLADYVAPLIKKLYAVDGTIRKAKKTNEVSLNYCCKNLILFKYSLGLPNGRKDNVTIPEKIFYSDFVTDCIKGLIDTDGGLLFRNRNKFAKPYPRIDFTSKSYPLSKQVSSKLSDFGFTYSIYHTAKNLKSTGNFYENDRIFIYGERNLDKWIDLIGFSNPKNIKKIENWYCNF